MAVDSLYLSGDARIEGIAPVKDSAQIVTIVRHAGIRTLRWDRSPRIRKVGGAQTDLILFVAVVSKVPYSAVAQSNRTPL